MNFPSNQQTEPFYLPAVIERWSVGWMWALANAFLDSFCIFYFKQKLIAFASALRACRGFSYFLFLFRIS